MLKLKFIVNMLLMHILFVSTVYAVHTPEFSTAGFFEVEGSGRSVHSMNPAWRFYKGDLPNASMYDYDDSEWPVVSLPHGIEYLPIEASGCINYQGPVWYRKHFRPNPALQGKKLFVHFEAIMGKSQVFVNGKSLGMHYGGYLPFVIDVTDVINWEKDNVIAVWADNSDDPIFPPGKQQEVLDYTYFGGIYRDCWLIAHHSVYITDPNFEDQIASGGLFVSFDKVSEKSAQINLKAHLRNAQKQRFSGSLEYELVNPQGVSVVSMSKHIRLDKASDASYTSSLIVKKPALWSPESPLLYNLFVRVKDESGKVVDGYRRRVGIRGIEFKGKDGFWLNGKPYGKPLMGANRHQDYALIGNAVPNSLHWRDAKKLRDTGLEMIRNAHCPQDPAFMDACDELGLFVINNTPGWQFWNEDPLFEKRVYEDIRNLVRRDRNHASMWLWEPILNETWYPANFAGNTRAIVDEEYPYPYCYSACDRVAYGSEHFSVLFSHPSNSGRKGEKIEYDPTKTYFTREWGDNVDDWSSHNSPSRVFRSWGEQPMLIQANHYAHPNYPYTSYDELHKLPVQHVGGALWHAFDHQRGYHPDPFYGGIMDVFRQPKYSYYMFKSQRSPVSANRIAESGPMVYIAHQMTPFSGKDVSVYSNCEEVRLTVNKEGKVYTLKKDMNRAGLPSPIFVFENVYDFMTDKNLSMYEHKQSDIFMVAEGIEGGQVVATHRIAPARRPENIRLTIDNENASLRADGSDIVTLVAEITDKNGNVKRLNNSVIRFHVEGEGRIIGNEEQFANPAPIRWGSAPVLIQSTLNPGKIKVTAELHINGSQVPLSGLLEFESIPAANSLVYDDNEARQISNSPISLKRLDLQKEKEQKEKNIQQLQEVEKQQSDFGEKK